MKRLGIIGCGQLGQMLGRAAKSLDADVYFLSINETPVVHGLGHVFDETEVDEFLSHVDCVTVEREAIPEDILRKVSDKVQLSPNYDSLIRLRSRHTQKAILDELNIPTAAWCYVEKPAEFAKAVADFPGTRIRAKRVLGGYDGGGQWRIDKNGPAVSIPDDDFPLIMEAEVDIDFEISVLVARAQDGSTQCYPLNENTMRDGILTWSFVPAEITETMADEARSYAKQLVNGIDYVGVLAMELFVSNGKLIANEIAPRVHNTGHWTIEGCECDQFEQHVRAVMGLQLRDPEPGGAAGMCNILGDMMPKALPREPVRLYLHGYGKLLRPGRKMGHLTLVGPELAMIRAVVKDIGLD